MPRDFAISAACAGWEGGAAWETARCGALTGRLALGLLQSRERDAKSVSDGGAILNHAHAQPLGLPCKPLVIEREWRERVSAPRKNDDPDAVVWAIIDERLDDGFDRPPPFDRDGNHGRRIEPGWLGAGPRGDTGAALEHLLTISMAAPAA